MEPLNISAWHLKGTAHSKLDEQVLADLSAAEEFLIRREYKRSEFFAKKVIKNSKSETPSYVRALDILNIVN